MVERIITKTLEEKPKAATHWSTRDMAKAVDKAMTITDIRLLSKTGGKSGDWSAE